MTSRHLVDPQLLPLLDLIPPIPVSAETLPAMRSRPRMFTPDPADVERTTLTIEQIPGRSGDPDVEILVYTPQTATAERAAVLHIHGGGYVAGDARELEVAHRRLCAELDGVIVSVNYRLAPETVFPGAIEDCYAALDWLFSNADALGVDRARIGVMGESAGGGLAAALALLARDRGEFSLAFQHLIYPMIDDRTCVQADTHPYVGEFVWTRASNVFGWTSLLGQAPGGDDVSPYAAAARAQDLSGLPPTYLATGALDLFLEEDLDYVLRLSRAGVPTELHVYPGAFHAFQWAAHTDVAKSAARDSFEALARAMGGVSAKNSAET